MFEVLFFQASVSEGDNDNNLTRITIGGLFLRQVFSVLLVELQLLKGYVYLPLSPIGL